MENELKKMTLYDLPIGYKAKVYANESKGEKRRRMLDIGLVQGTWVECLRISPIGEPKAFKIRGAIIALRNEDAGEIIVDSISE